MAGISVEVSAQYPGRFKAVPKSWPNRKAGTMPREKSAEAIVGRLATEGPNIKTRNGALVPDERRRARTED